MLLLILLEINMLIIKSNKLFLKNLLNIIRFTFFIIKILTRLMRLVGQKPSNVLFNMEC